MSSFLLYKKKAGNQKLPALRGITNVFSDKRLTTGQLYKKLSVTKAFIATANFTATTGRDNILILELDDFHLSLGILFHWFSLLS